MRGKRPISALLLLLASLSVAPGARSGGPEGQAGKIVKVSVAVDPATVAPGGEAEVLVKVSPRSGIKLNRYPKIRMAVPEIAGFVAAAEGSVGSDSPPPPERMETNYFGTVDPLRLTLRLDPAAARGARKIEAKLSYFYCVAASGFCAPAKEIVPIPITVR